MHRQPHVRKSNIKIRLYTWYGPKEAFGIVYNDGQARDALIARLTKSTGKKPKPVYEFIPAKDRVPSDYDAPISAVKNERLRNGWIRNVKISGAILALGLSAL